MSEIKKDERPLRRYRLKVGNHIGPDLEQEPVEIKDGAGNTIQRKYPSKTWVQGQIVEAREDLVKIGGDAKFELLGAKKKAGAEALKALADKKAAMEDPDDEEEEEEDTGLSYMTVQQLKQYAEQHKIDLKGARTKDEMVNAIRAAEADEE